MSQYLIFYVVNKDYLKTVLNKDNESESFFDNNEKNSLTLFFRSRNSKLFYFWSAEFPIHGKLTVLTKNHLETIIAKLKKELERSRKEKELFELKSTDETVGNEKLELLKYLKSKTDEKSDIVDRMMFKKISDFISRNCFGQIDYELYEEIINDYVGEIDEYEETIERLESMLEFIENRDETNNFEYVWYME